MLWLYSNSVSTIFKIFGMSENFSIWTYHATHTALILSKFEYGYRLPLDTLFSQLNLLELCLYSTACIITKSFVFCHITSSQLFPRLCITECIHFEILSLTYQLIIPLVSKIMTDQNYTQWSSYFLGQLLCYWFISLLLSHFHTDYEN